MADAPNRVRANAARSALGNQRVRITGDDSSSTTVTPADEVADLATAKVEIATLREALARAAERERTLADDLHHRVRNLLAMIRSITRQSWEEGADPEDYAQHLQGRLDAIARYQTRFGGLRSTGFDLEDMVRDELLQTGRLDGPTCTISGPAVSLRGREAELFGLALHELTTNAIKYGALAGNGRLSVDWAVEDGGLAFRWVEAGVAVAAPAPRRSGFGHRLIGSGLPYELGATTTFELRPGGLVCTILLPIDDAGEAVSLRPSEPREQGR